MGYFDEKLDIVSELRLRVDELRSNREIIAKLESRNDFLIDRIHILTGSADEEDFNSQTGIELIFNDSDRLVRWKGGTMKFRSSGQNQYRFLKLIYEAGDEGIEHESIAESIFGDQCYDLKDVFRNTRNKMAENHCPVTILNKNDFFWILKTP